MWLCVQTCASGVDRFSTFAGPERAPGGRSAHLQYKPRFRLAPRRYPAWVSARVSGAVEASGRRAYRRAYVKPSRKCRRRAGHRGLPALPEAVAALHLRQRHPDREPPLAPDPAAPAGAGPDAWDRAADRAAFYWRGREGRPVLAEPRQGARPACCRPLALGGALSRLGEGGSARSRQGDRRAQPQGRDGRQPACDPGSHRRGGAARWHLEPGQGAVVAQSVDAEMPARDPGTEATFRLWGAASRAAP